MIYDVFNYVCHQLVDRVLIVGGSYLPCCARCAGIYTGFAVTAVYHLFVNGRFKLWPTPAGFTLAAASLVINFVEYAGSWWFGLFGGLANYPRFLISLALGWGGFILLTACATFIQVPRDRRPRDHPGSLLIGLVACLGQGLLPLTNSKPAWYVLAWASAAGMVMFYGYFNYLPVALAIRLTNWRPGALGYALVAIGIGAALVGEWFLHAAFFQEISGAVRSFQLFFGLGG